MKKPYGLVEVSVKVFKVLAWITLVLQVAVGLLVLVRGGDPVLIGDVEVPARLIGFLNCLGGAVYFFLLSVVAAVLRLLLDVREQMGGRSPA
jgi:hypothetical protein